MAFLGSTPIGGPIVGWIGQNLGPRYALAVGGLAALAAGLLAYPRLSRLGRDADRNEDTDDLPPLPDPVVAPSGLAPAP